MPLPIQEVLPEIRAALAEHNRVILNAPPGAGKTTGVPPALLDEPWLKREKILILEPRRLAARAASRRMAGEMGEKPGQTVGYRVRMETRVGPGTRIEVLTEGILTRMIQADPELTGVGLVVFDEFHERHLQGDLGLALCLDAQKGLRPDLRVMVMSVTLNLPPLEKLMAPAPVIDAPGQVHPVAVHYQDGPTPDSPVGHTLRAIPKALNETQGGILVFLPGTGEIRRVLKGLEPLDLGDHVTVAPLFGDLPAGEQDRAIAPAPAGIRKIVLATDIAESSLTIAGIRVVIDAGLCRRPRFDSGSGLTRLETLPISRASADQRRGRAGRTGPGVAYRLWTRAAHGQLPEHLRPEVRQADLAPLVLELALWGVAGPDDLRWVDTPPASACSTARALLCQLGALGPDFRITPHGKKMAALGLHPRLAHMILSSRAGETGRAACILAALLSERDIFKSTTPKRGRPADLGLRMAVLHRFEKGPTAPVDGVQVDAGACRRVLAVARRLARRCNIRWGAAVRTGAAGWLLALAYPDRIGARRPGGQGRFLLSGGRGAWLPESDPMAACDHLVAAHLDARAEDARIFLAAAVDMQAVETRQGHLFSTEEAIRWDRQQKAVQCEVRKRLGRLVLETRPMRDPDPEQVAAAMIEGIRLAGIHALPWTRKSALLRWRVDFLHWMDGADSLWPDLSDPALLKKLETWLAPWIGGMTRLAHLKRLKLADALRGMLTWQQIRDLDRLAPTHLKVPSGSNIALDYSQGQNPVLPVKIQEMFGVVDTPRIAGGKAPVRLHLLSPAGRPVQVTEDLAGFWQRTYHEVRKDLRGRYPKHAWPEDPLSAAPTRGVRRRRRPKS
jgi:ATP-dependent RNA helicase HrpB